MVFFFIFKLFCNIPFYIDLTQIFMTLGLCQWFFWFSVFFGGGFVIKWAILYMRPPVEGLQTNGLFLGGRVGLQLTRTTSHPVEVRPY